MEIPDFIENHTEQLEILCRRHRVDKLYAFGSILTDQFDPLRSDIDLVVELEDMPVFERGENLIQLWEGLEDLFDKKVDLISKLPVSNPFLRATIDETKQLIYDRESEEVSV